MRKIFSRFTKNQSGQGALGIVLILLLLGGFILPPLLSFMGTGLKAGQMHEVKTEGYYAADSGIEDTCWKIKNTYTYYASPIGSSYELSQPVNKMKVKVEKLNQQPTEDGATLYTIKSTAWLEGDPQDEQHKKGEIIAKIKGVSHGLEGESGPGSWKTPHSEVTTAITAMDWETLILQIKQSGVCRFCGAGDGDECTDFEPYDLLGLNVTSGHAWRILDGGSSGWNIDCNDFGDVHYHTGDAEVLISLSSPDKPKVQGTKFSPSDIITLGPNIKTEPDGDTILAPGAVNSTPWLDLQHYFDKIVVSAFDVLPSGDIVFAPGGKATLKDSKWAVGGQDTFESYQLVLFNNNATNPKFRLYLDAFSVLSPMNPGVPSTQLKITGVASLLTKDGVDDGRLLLSFDTGGSGGISDSCGGLYRQGDIALWTPGECAYDCTLSPAQPQEPCPWHDPWTETPYYDPHAGWITAHINLHAQGGEQVPPVDLQIVSWNIEE